MTERGGQRKKGKLTLVVWEGEEPCICPRQLETRENGCLVQSSDLRDTGAAVVSPGLSTEGSDAKSQLLEEGNGMHRWGHKCVPSPHRLPLLCVGSAAQPGRHLLY